MKNLKILLVFLVPVCFSSKIFSQYYYYDNPFYFEIGAGISAMNCITDIGGANGDKTFYLNEMRGTNFRPGGSIYASAIYHDLIGARIELSRGRIKSADSDTKPTTGNAESRRLRNLSFRSSITEVSLMLEFYPLSLFNFQEKHWLIDPYLIGGGGWYSFNPQAEYNGSWVDLRPLHTEGEGFPEYPAINNYKLSQYNIPLGIGLRYSVSPKLYLRLEYLHRVLFTDYLEDVSSKKFINLSAFGKNLSPADAAAARALYNRREDGKIPARRGNPNDNDTYMSLSVKVGMIIGRQYKP